MLASPSSRYRILERWRAIVRANDASPSLCRLSFPQRQFIRGKYPGFLHDVELANNFPGHEELEANTANIVHTPALKGFCNAPQLEVKGATCIHAGQITVPRLPDYIIEAIQLNLQSLKPEAWHGPGFSVKL